MQMNLTYREVARTGSRFSQDVAQRAVEEAELVRRMPGGVDPDDPFEAHGQRPPILDRRPLEIAWPGTIERMAELASMPPHRGAPRCFLVDRKVTTGAALLSLRERLCQAQALVQLAHQAPAESEHGQHVAGATSDVLHEAAFLLAVVEVAMHEEQDHQIRHRSSDLDA